MGDGEDQPIQDSRRQREEMDALSARVAALEQQIANLRSAVTPAPLDSRTAAAESASQKIPAPPPPPPIPGAAQTPSASTFASAAPAHTASLENRLGSQIFSRIGIIAVLIGAALFLKWAIDNQWIGPTGRVLAGLLAGAALIVWSERFRRKGFAAFSYSLKAVGSGVLYLSLWAAFQLYHLLPAGAALAAMLLVTAWNAYMAWAQNSQLLAAYALIGGTAAPLLVSTGGNHEVFLFTYLLAIAASTVALVRLRPWPRLLLGVFPATVGYFIGWYIEFYSDDQFLITSIFVSLFFLLFTSVPLRTPGPSPTPEPDTPKRPTASTITEIFLPLGNAIFGSLAFYSILQDAHHHDWLPWMVVAFAAVYLALMRLPQSAAAAAVHLSLAIVFITIAVPLKASDRWITVSWLVEGAALLWVAAHLAAANPASAVTDDSPAGAFRVLRTLALAALLLGLASLVFDWQWFDSNLGQAFFNRRYSTALVGIAAFATAVWIALHARRDQSATARLERDSQVHDNQVWLQIGGASIIAVNLIAVLATVREIAALWPADSANPDAELRQALAISAFLMFYGAVLLAVGFWKRTAFIRWQALLLIVSTIAKTFLYDMRNLSQGYRVASFMALGVLLLAVSFAYQNDWLSLRNKSDALDAQAGERP